jgi:hypothetical protein
MKTINVVNEDLTTVWNSVLQKIIVTRSQFIENNSML